MPKARLPASDQFLASHWTPSANQPTAAEWHSSVQQAHHGENVAVPYSISQPAQWKPNRNASSSSALYRASHEPVSQHSVSQEATYHTIRSATYADYIPAVRRPSHRVDRHRSQWDVHPETADRRTPHTTSQRTYASAYAGGSSQSLAYGRYERVRDKPRLRNPITGELKPLQSACMPVGARRSRNHGVPRARAVDPVLTKPIAHISTHAQALPTFDLPVLGSLEAVRPREAGDMDYYASRISRRATSHT